MQADAYGPITRWMHRLALGIPAVRELMLDTLGRVTEAELEQCRHGRHVFIAGLARSGSTVLLQRLYATGAFSSLTYRHMPFVLAPRLWGLNPERAVSERVRRERAHGDGLLVDAFDPEAFEEVFWLSTDSSGYMKADGLHSHSPEMVVQQRFLRYVAAILKHERPIRERYLSKNNNNLLRLQGLADCFPEADFIIPFRSPLQHAASLLSQHRRFQRMASEDGFVADYMRWLGHFEFGPSHRPFQLGKDANPLRTDCLDYWLRTWLDVYAWLGETAPTHAIWISQEGIAQSGAPAWEWLRQKLDLKNDGDGPEFIVREHAVDEAFDPALLADCEQLHQTMLRRHLGP